MDQLAADQFIDILSERKFRKSLIKELNECVDIPFINENVEKHVMDKLYSVILKVIKDKIKEN